MGDPQQLGVEVVEEIETRAHESLELHRRHVNPGFVDLLHMVGYGRRFVSASGLELVDERGQRYLDFLSGYGVLNLGHNHPAVKSALAAALARDLPGFTQVECAAHVGLAAEALTSALPGDLQRVFFCSSGSEAVEAAVKLARAATGKKRLVGVEGAYHGKTMGALPLMDNPDLRDRYRPLMPGVERIPFDDLDALDRVLRWGDVAALVVEPVLGEGGALAASTGYLAGALRRCHDRGALLVVDEVQTGMGRTGRLCAFQHEEGLVPDVVCLAKALGGGLVPVGATVARAEVFDRAYGAPQTSNQHTATFGGGPLAMTAVLATLRVIKEEGLCENAALQGAHLTERLEELAKRHSATVAGVRGRGLMLGFKLKDLARGLLERTVLKKLGAASAALFSQYVALRLMEDHHIVTQAAGNDMAVLKVMPPLSVTREAVDRFADALDVVLSSGGHAKALYTLATELIRHRRK